MATHSQIQKIRNALKGQKYKDIATCNVCAKDTNMIADIDKNKATCSECKSSIAIPNNIYDGLIKQLKSIGIQI